MSDTYCRHHLVCRRFCCECGRRRIDWSNIMADVLFFVQKCVERSRAPRTTAKN